MPFRPILALIKLEGADSHEEGIAPEVVLGLHQQEDVVRDVIPVHVPIRMWLLPHLAMGGRVIKCASPSARAQSQQ